MTALPQLSAGVLGQIALMQSVVAQLPDRTSVMRFAQSGLSDVVGVQEVRFELMDPPKTLEPRATKPDLNTRIFPIHHRTRLHGYFQIQLNDPAAFEPYAPYIENFCNMLALIFEDHQHRENDRLLRAELERKVAEQTAELRRFKIITDRASYGAAIFTLEGVLEYVNEQFARMHGFSREELLGQHLSFLHTPEQMPRADALLAELRKNQEFAAEEVWRRKKDGSTFPALMNATLIQDEAGKPIYISASATDISELKAIEAEKAKIQAQIHQAQRLDSIGQLAGGVAHDFNNVLGGIIGATDVIKIQLDSDNPENVQPMLDLILRAAERAGDLTRKLLSFARRNPMDFTPMDVHQAVKDSVALLSSTLDKRIQIVMALEASPSIVVGDPAQLQNVFLNLGINASHAMAEGGTLTFRSRIIDCECETETESDEQNGAKDGCIEIEVNDTGCGIAPEHLPLIFDPFFTTKPMDKGTGMGLSEALGTIQQHKGHIRAYSELGQGTSFKVSLPLSTSSSIPEPTADQLRSGTETILLVDDELFIIEIGKKLLNSYGYQVLSAPDGAKAVEIYRSKPDKIDLVILDMIMPIMNGRDCFNEIRTINPKAKVILSSGFSREQDLQEMQAHGLNAFIKKPFRSKELNRIVYEVLKSQP